MHPIEADIRNWSKNFLEVPSDKLNGLPPCPYAADAWLKNKVKFDINTGFEGLTKQIKEFDNHKYDIVIWACDERYLKCNILTDIVMESMRFCLY